MTERRSLPSLKTKTMLERSSTPSNRNSTTAERRQMAPVSRNGNVGRLSFNARLGANGPADTDSPKSDKKHCDLEDISTQLAGSSTHSSPENVKSFNDRLNKVRNDDSQKTASDVSTELDESVIFNGSERVQEESANQSLDKILATYIKEESPTGIYYPSDLNKSFVSSESFTADLNECRISDISSVSLSENMSKRDFLGNEKTESNILTNCCNRKCSVNEDVIKEESDFKVEGGRKAIFATEPEEADRKFNSRRNDYEPKQNESPQCKADEISRSDFPTSFGSKRWSSYCEAKPEEAHGKFKSRHSDIYQPKRSESPQSSAAKISRNDYPTSFGTKGRRSTSFDADVMDEVEKYFNKRFYLSKKNDWILPEPSKLFSSEPWEVEELIACKDKLNAVKEKLDDLELREWHAHTKKRNKAGQVVSKLRKMVNPEFPTQAWCKFYENMCTFQLIPKKARSDQILNSVHLCEAPGAFITSLNHYIKTNFDDDFKWNWLGTTLNPHYEGNPLSLMINEDRFILHTMKHWTFGEDQTGDLMNPPNLEDLKKRAEEMGEVLLVTADGSIDCQDDPGEQENVVAWLHFCEAVSALSVLAKGGNFLVKIFTIFEHMTICLLYFLSSVFEEVIVNKPATSKEGNSETYVICKNYVGRTSIEPWLSALVLNYGPNRPRKALFPKSAIPEEFLRVVIECAETFRVYQTAIIEANLESFNNPNDREILRNGRIRRAVTDEFFVRYRLKELPEEFDIVGRDKINKMETYNVDPRLEIGTFSERMKRKEVPERQKMLDLKEDIERLERQVLEKWSTDNNLLWYKFDSDSGHNLSKDIKISTGKPVKCINSSKFCLGLLLDIRNKVREIILNSKACDLPDFNTTTEKLVEVPSRTIVLDFKNTLWSSSDAGLMAEEEFRAFKEILKEYDNLARDDSLVIYGYPLLTQFNVGLVYLLAHSFQRVGITRPRGQNFAIIFEKHESNIKKFKVKEKLDEISENIQPLGKTVLAMLPIQILCKGQFYKYVTMANNICVKEQVLELITKYLLATESKEDREKRRRTTS